MTTILTHIADPVGSGIITDIQVNNVVQADVAGAAPGILMLEVDNVNNSTAVWFKMWDMALPIIGTTPPHLKFKIGAGKNLKMNCLNTGLLLDNALSYACVTESAVTGNTAPLKAVDVKILLG